MKNIINLLLILTVFTLLLNCEKEENFEAEVQNKQIIEQPDGIPTILGKKLNIPFTVENMQKAYDNLKNNTSLRKLELYSKMNTEQKIEASHYYYRFLPKNIEQFDKLVNDTILQVSDVPLEYDVETSGDYYKDPTLKNSDFTYYYSVFPVNYNFPKEIEAEKIVDLYFPPEEGTEEIEKGEIKVNQPLNKTSRKLLETFNHDFFDKLETEALRITNNLDEDELSALTFKTPNGKSTLTYTQVKEKGHSTTELEIDYSEEFKQVFRRKKWNPHGRVTVEEGVLTQIGSSNNIVGVMGAEIKVRKWGFLVIKRALTDTNGNFRTSSTRTKRVKYAVYFGTPAVFVVKAGTIFWNARHRGHRRYKRDGWFQHFSEGGRSHLYALVQNAAFDYYFRIINEYNLSRPRFTKISAKYDKSGSSEHRAGILTLLPVSQIKITRKKNNTYRESDGIYATTIHELTHAGHRQMDMGMFSVLERGSKNRDILTESWAEGVETIVTNDRYFGLDANYQSSHRNDRNGRWNSWRQRESTADMNKYTPIVEDLIDNLNQNSSLHTPGVQPVDRVFGYSLNQIQNSLDNCRDIDCWENNLRNNYTNSTENNLTELFDYVRVVRNNM